MARKEWPASQKLSPWSKAQAVKVVVAPPVPPRELADLGGQSGSQESRNPSTGREGNPSPKAQVGEKRGGSADVRQECARPRPRGRKAPARGQAAPKVTPDGQHGAAAAPRTSHPAQAGDATIPASPAMALPPLSPSLPQPASTLARHRRRRSWGDAPFVFKSAAQGPRPESGCPSQTPDIQAQSGTTLGHSSLSIRHRRSFIDFVCL